jgi:predicted DNA-binding protein
MVSTRRAKYTTIRIPMQQNQRLKTLAKAEQRSKIGELITLIDNKELQLKEKRSKE